MAARRVQAISRLGEDPFATPPELRDPTRRLRGRLALPVTVWTTAAPVAGRVGLTVSSVLVAEGEPPFLLGLIGPLSDFFEALQESGRFVVQVLGAEERRVAELFAGRYPSADPFEEVGASDSPFGPVLAGGGAFAGCALTGSTEVGYSVLVQGRIEEHHPGTGRPPLLYYQGAYATLEPEAGPA